MPRAESERLLFASLHVRMFLSWDHRLLFELVLIVNIQIYPLTFETVVTRSLLTTITVLYVLCASTLR